MDYLEDCATNGCVYGEIFVHISAQDADRFNDLASLRFKKATRTTVRAAATIREKVTEWKEKTRRRVAATLTK
jgi:hypothetical protein